MALLLVGLLKEDMALPPDLPAHALISYNGGAGLVIEVEPASAETENGITEWARRQNSFLCGLISHADVLPVPLGAVFSSAAAARAYLSQNWESFEEPFERVADHVEFSLTVRAIGGQVPQDTPPTSGRSFLKARQGRRLNRQGLSRDRAAVLPRFRAEFEGACRETLDGSNKNSDRLLFLAGLVKRTKVTDMIEALSGVADAASSLNLSSQLIGPSPAYSFAQWPSTARMPAHV